MPNKKGGKKFKKGKKGGGISTSMIYKDVKEDQEYARVDSVYGSGRYKLFCFDGQERLGIAAGNIKRMRISLKDIVLISKWDFQDSKCSIVFKYDEEQVHKLKSMNEFPANLQLDDFEIVNNEDDIFDYSIDNISDDEKEDLKQEDNDEDDEDDEDEYACIDLEDI